MKNSKSLFFCYTAGVMLLFLYSMHAYFLWWMYDAMIYKFLLDIMVAMCGFVYILQRKIHVHHFSTVLLPFLCVWFVDALNPAGVVWVVSKCPLALVTLLLLDKDSLLKMLKVWTNMYAIILSVSLVAWLLALSGFLPSHGIISLGDNISYTYQNYLFCLVNMDLSNLGTIRFSSIFLEPGHVAMIGAFTLYANRFDFKRWSTWVILIVSLVTFSLAGYILIIIGSLFIILQKSSFGQIVKGLILLAVLFIPIYHYAVSYNNGDNLINTLIFERMEYDDEKGFVGNNRTNIDTDYVFERFLHSPLILTGFDFETYQKYLTNKTISGAGYKLYFMEKGILGILVVVIAYIYIAKKRGLDRRFMYFFILLYIISSYQRMWPTSYIWLFLFILATAQKHKMMHPQNK